MDAAATHNTPGKKRKNEVNKKKKQQEKNKKQPQAQAQAQAQAQGDKTKQGGLDPNKKLPSTSLASRLKRQRGTAATTALPPEWSGASSSTPKFLSPDDDDDFDSCVKECYRGFSYEKPNELPPQIHDTFSSSFDTINDAGLFLYDVVQPGGKKLSLTFVTRTLVGDPGSTYKYLGLRLFSHPWCDVDDDGNGKVVGNPNGELKSKGGKSLTKLGYSKNCTRALMQMGLTNHDLVGRTNKLLQTEISPLVKDGLVGSAEYTLTLINRMEPSTIKKDLKDDSIHGIGKTSVSWHKDSGLQDFSSIAVYHTLKDIRGGNKHDLDQKTDLWKVAIRVADANTRTPALSVPLPSGTLYYLLDDFNHQHEHAVIAGSDSLRYSSTHRVARDGVGNWQYIRDKCKSILSSDLCTAVLQSEMGKAALASYYNNSSKRKQLAKEVRACQQLMTELEFEWIRQWHIQGRHHATLHPYWHIPMQRMKDSYKQLDQVTSHVNSLLQESSKSTLEIVSEDLFDVAIEAVENRYNLRSDWEQRLIDSIFKTLPMEARPFPCSMFDDTDVIQPSDIRNWRSAFVNMKEGNDADDKESSGNKRKRKDKTTSMTKKEKKRSSTASNWEKMKKKM